MHRMPPVDRKWWCVNPHDALDFLFDIVPITSIDIATARIILHMFILS